MTSGCPSALIRSACANRAAIRASLWQRDSTSPFAEVTISGRPRRGRARAAAIIRSAVPAVETRDRQAAERHTRDTREQGGGRLWLDGAKVALRDGHDGVLTRHSGYSSAPLPETSTTPRTLPTGNRWSAGTRDVAPARHARGHDQHGEVGRAASAGPSVSSRSVGPSTTSCSSCAHGRARGGSRPDTARRCCHAAGLQHHQTGMRLGDQCRFELALSSATSTRPAPLPPTTRSERPRRPKSASTSSTRD